MAAMKPQSFGELTPKVVLGIAAHPDDLDFGAGGTLATFAQQGAQIHYVQITDGCKGSADPNLSCQEVAELRQHEQQAACDAIGGTAVHFLSHTDGELQATLELKAELVKLIRELKPDVVITTDPSSFYDARYGIINHADHRAAGEAAIDAVYPLARDHLTFPELGEPHKVATVLITTFSDHNYFVDITGALNAKLAAVKAHASQVSNYDDMASMFTDMATELGQSAGYRYAEGFVRLDVTP